MRKEMTGGTRARRLVRRALVVGLAVLLVALGWALLSYARVAAGYAATITAMQVFGAGDGLERVAAERLRMPLGLGRFVSLSVEPGARTARAEAFKLVAREATWREGLGAVRHVDPAPPLPALPAEASPSAGAPAWSAAAPAELLPAARLALDAAVAAAFVTPDGRPVESHAVVVAHRGVLVAERYADGVGPETRLLGWSMTKSVLALLAGRMVELGLIGGPGTPVLAPEWSAPGDPRRAITLEHLLRMTSGLAFHANYELPWSDSLQMLFVEPDAAAFAAAKPLEHPPGTHWSYSDGTSNVLARWLQERAGATPAGRLAFPGRELFAPLGIRSAVISVDPSGHWVGSSLMQASARDWARLGQLVLDDGVVGDRRLLPEGWVDVLARPTPGSPGLCYGGHVWRHDERLLLDGVGRPVPPELAGVLYFAGHDQQFVWIDRGRGLVIVRLGLFDERFDPPAFAAAVVRALAE